MPSQTATIRTTTPQAGRYRLAAAGSSSRPAELTKDVLRVGAWHLSSGERWQVTRRTLADIAHHTNAAIAAGNRFIWRDAPEHETGKSTDELGHVLSLTVSSDGSKLIARLAATTPRGRRWLADLGVGDSIEGSVSVEVDEPWSDGVGNEYPVCLTGLVSCLRPIVTGQEPFRRVASKARPQVKLVPKPRRTASMPTKRLAEGDPAAPASESVDATVDTVKELKVYLAAKGVNLDTSAGDEDDAIPVADIVKLVDAMSGSGESEEPASEEPPAGEADMSGAGEYPPVPGETTMLSKIRAERDQLRRQLAKVEADRLASERANFAAECDELTRVGAMTPAEKKAILTDADADKRYRLSVLMPFRRIATTAQANRRLSQMGATGSAPVPGDRPDAKEVEAHQKRILERLTGAKT